MGMRRLVWFFDVRIYLEEDFTFDMFHGKFHDFITATLLDAICKHVRPAGKIEYSPFICGQGVRC